MIRPGDRLRALAAGLCDQPTLQRVIDPIVADLQWEHGQAVRRGERWRSRAIRIGATFTLLKVMVAKMDWTPNSGGLLMRTAGYSLTAIACVMMLFALPIFLANPFPTNYFVYFIPQMLGLAIPIGIAIGIVGALAGVALSSKVKTGVIAIALAGVVGGFVTAGWIGPMATHAMRVASGIPNSDLSDLDARSPAELTLGQLRDRMHKAADFGLSPYVGYLRFMLEIYYGRWAFPVASLTLALCLLAVAGFPGAGRKTLGGAAFALVMGYEAAAVFAARLNQHSAIPVVLAAWLPNLLLVLAALSIAMLGRRSRASISL